MKRYKAYDMIDHFLSNNLDSDNFKQYRAALDVLWRPLPGHAEKAVIDAAKVMDDVIRHPKICRYHEYVSARDGLLTAVATLRKLEEET